MDMDIVHGLWFALLSYVHVVSVYICTCSKFEDAIHRSFFSCQVRTEDVCCAFRFGFAVSETVVLTCKKMWLAVRTELGSAVPLVDISRD